jgi:hypothetical protein
VRKGEWAGKGGWLAGAVTPIVITVVGNVLATLFKQLSDIQILNSFKPLILSGWRMTISGQQTYPSNMGPIGEVSNTETQLTSILAEDGGFPNDRIFSTFLSRCNNAGSRIAFHEPDNGVSASFDQFMTDIIHQRHYLRKHFLPHLDENGILKEAFPICVHSTANYEFSIAAMGILALGGLVVPLREYHFCHPLHIIGHV